MLLHTNQRGIQRPMKQAPQPYLATKQIQGMRGMKREGQILFSFQIGLVTLTQVPIKMLIWKYNYSSII